MSKINVLIVPTWLPTGKDKLMGIYHQVFCSALNDDNDISSDILYIDRQRLINPIKYIFMKKFVIEKKDNYKIYKYRILDLSKISLKLSLKVYTKALDKLYLKYLKDNEKPDIIHAQVTIPAGYASCIIGKRYNIKVIVTEHSSYFKRFFEDQKEYSDFVLKNSYFTTVSNYTKNEMLNYTDSCDIIPNIVDTDAFLNVRRSNNNELNLISVCALRQGKNIDDLIKAVKIIVDQNTASKIHLNIVGDGYLEDYYKDICTSLKMDNYISFLGRKTKEEIASLFEKSDIFVISSELETFCIPGLEALAAGIPVVSTKCKGPIEYLNDRTGKLCNIKDPQDMANAIIQVYKNIESYDDEYLRSIASKFDKKSVVYKAKEIYNNIKKS